MGIGAAIISLRRAVLSAKRLLEPGAADAAPEDDDDDDR
jgi:hypothetical protein